MSSERHALADDPWWMEHLSPRVRKLVTVILLNQEAICERDRAVFEADLHGDHVNARVLPPKPKARELRLDGGKGDKGTRPC